MLGAMLGRALGGLMQVESVECVRLEEEFRATVLPSLTRTLRFECSMLQTPVEDASGSVRWRDVVCGDEDDFAPLWAMRHTVEGSVRQESVLLPSEKPVEAGYLGNSVDDFQ
jgi:hypothetical protein